MSVTPIAATAAIPMMAADGVTAINTAASLRQGLLGAMVTPSPGGPLSWRPGVVPTSVPSSSYGPYLDLRVSATPTADQTVHIGPGNAVIVRSGASGGPYIVNFGSAATMPLDPNPTTNSRYDVVYAQLVDAALGDTGTQGAQINVVEGTPGATPVVPAIPTGAIPLAAILRPSFATNGNTNYIFANQITDMRRSTGLGNGVRPLLPGDAITDPGSYPGEMSFDAVSSQISGLRIFDGKIWHGIAPKYYFGSNSFGTSVTINGGPNTPYNDVTPFSISIPDPGYPYHVAVSGKYGGSALNNGMHWQTKVGNTPLMTCYVLPGNTWEVLFPMNASPTITGSTTVTMRSGFDLASTSFVTSAVPSVMYLTALVLPDF